MTIKEYPYYRAMMDRKTGKPFFEKGMGRKFRVEGIVFYIEKIEWWNVTEESTGTMVMPLQDTLKEVMDILHNTAFIETVKKEVDSDRTAERRNRLREFAEKERKEGGSDGNR